MGELSQIATSKSIFYFVYFTAQLFLINSFAQYFLVVENTLLKHDTHVLSQKIRKVFAVLSKARILQPRTALKRSNDLSKTLYILLKVKTEDTFASFVCVPDVLKDVVLLTPRFSFFDLNKFYLCVCVDQQLIKSYLNTTQRSSVKIIKIQREKRGIQLRAIIFSRGESNHHLQRYNH